MFFILGEQKKNNFGSFSMAYSNVDINIVNIKLSNWELAKSNSNNSSVSVKLSKAQMSKIIQSERFLGKLIEPFMKAG